MCVGFLYTEISGSPLLVKYLRSANCCFHCEFNRISLAVQMLSVHLQSIMQYVSYTYLFHTRGLTGAVCSVLQTFPSILVLAITGETGEPIATPLSADKKSAHGI